MHPRNSNTPSIIKPQSNLQVAPLTIIAPSLQIFSQLEKGLSLHCSTHLTKNQTSLPGNVTLATFDLASVIGPIVGAPLAVLTVESLLNSGTNKLLLVSVAGALDPDNAEFQIGDIVFPSGAISEDGTSRSYGAKEIESFPHDSLQLDLEASINDNFHQQNITTNFHSGHVWTTDTPYLESLAKVQHYKTLGAVVVDMEFAALLQLAKIYDAKLACVFVISDILGNKWENGFRSKKFKSNLKTVISSVIGFL